MENKLRMLFDFQRYEKNADLQRVIDAVHARTAKRELNLEEMEWIAAAGNPNAGLVKNNPETDRK